VAAPAAGRVFDQPGALDAGLHRQLRRKLSLRRRQDLVVGLRGGDARDDLVELAAIRRELGELCARASVISIKGSRVSGSR
jgi:hypothetical protein